MENFAVLLEEWCLCLTVKESKWWNLWVHSNRGIKMQIFPYLSLLSLLEWITFSRQTQLLSTVSLSAASTQMTSWFCSNKIVAVCPLATRLMSKLSMQWAKCGPSLQESLIKCHYLACLWPNLKAKQEINTKWGQIIVSVDIPDSSHKGLSARNRFLPFTLSFRSSVAIKRW